MGSIIGSGNGIADTINSELLQVFLDSRKDKGLIKDLKKLLSVIKNEDRELDDLYKQDPGSLMLNYLKALDIYKSASLNDMTSGYGWVLKGKISQKLNYFSAKFNEVDEYLSRSFAAGFGDPWEFDFKNTDLEDLEFENIEEAISYKPLIHFAAEQERLREDLNKELEKANNTISENFRSYMHTIGNVLNPDIIYNVAQSIHAKNYSETDVASALIKAYMAEKFIIARKDLARLKFSGEGELFNEIEKEKTENGEAGETIEQVLIYCVERILSYGLFKSQNEHSILRTQLKNSSKLSLPELRRLFLDDVFLNSAAKVFDWTAKYLYPVEYRIDEAWTDIKFVRNGLLSTMLIDHLQELISNALKYRDTASPILMKLAFSSEITKGESYLTITSVNAASAEESGRFSGLQSIRDDLELINGQKNVNIIIARSEAEFSIRLFYKADILGRRPH